MVRRPRGPTLFPYTTLFRSGVAPDRMAPSIPVDLVIDHSVQVDSFGARGAYERNIDMEYERNAERYALLDRKSTRLNSSHVEISYAVFCLKKKINARPPSVA